MAHTRKRKLTIADIMERNKEAGRYFFSKDTMKFFNSRIEPEVYGDGYFITSERRRGESILFTIRKFNKKEASISTVGDFQEFSTKTQAKKRVKEIVGE